MEERITKQQLMKMYNVNRTTIEEWRRSSFLFDYIQKYLLHIANLCKLIKKELGLLKIYIIFINLGFNKTIYYEI